MTAESDRMTKILWRLAWLRKTRRTKKTSARKINQTQLQSLAGRIGRPLKRLWELSAACDGALLGIVALLLFCLYIAAL